MSESLRPEHSVPCPLCSAGFRQRCRTTTGTDRVTDTHAARVEAARADRQTFPTADYAGTNKARQEVGDPGHCEACAEHGHVKAHPDLGCGDVGCDRAHGDDAR